MHLRLHKAAYGPEPLAQISLDVFRQVGGRVLLPEAAALEPGNPLAIAEQAFTFEKMSLPEKAAEQWKRILVMGDRAGVYYSAAKSKLETALQDTMRTTGGGPEIAKGKVLSIGAIKLEEDADRGTAKKFALTVPVNARAAKAVFRRKAANANGALHDRGKGRGQHEQSLADHAVKRKADFAKGRF